MAMNRGPSVVGRAVTTPDAPGMDALTLTGTAVGLAMDAAAVCVLTSVRVPALTLGQGAQMAATFGLFQAAMPCLGFLIGASAHRAIDRFDHWIVFGILAGIGAKMLWEASVIRRRSGDPVPFPRLGTLLALGLATSIDALAAGLGLELIGADMLLAAVVIGGVTTALSAAGLVAGRRLGASAGAWAEVVGGVVLIALGTRILAEHLLAA